MKKAGFDEFTGISKKARGVMSSVYDYIKESPFPLKSALIERSFSLRGQEVRSIVNHYRNDMYLTGRGENLIVSNHKGYSYARTPEEIEETIAHLTERRNSLTRLINSLETGKANIKYQGLQRSLF